MSRRSRPTARQVRLGTELRKLRQGAGVTARDAARLLGIDQAKMAHLEAGRVAVGTEHVRTLAAHFGVTDEAFVEALAVMADERERGWWRDYEGTVSPVLLDLATFEHHARTLRALQVLHIPGLLQTEGYVRAMLTQTMPELSADQLKAIVEFRVNRRRILDGDSPPRLTVQIHEAALRIKVADREVACEQLEFLLETATRPAVSVRVVPFETDGFTGSGFSMLYLEGSVPQLDTAQFDTVHGSILEDEEARLANYRSILDRVEKMALSEKKSRDFIHQITRQL